MIEDIYTMDIWQRAALKSVRELGDVIEQEICIYQLIRK